MLCPLAKCRTINSKTQPVTNVNYRKQHGAATLKSLFPSLTHSDDAQSLPGRVLLGWAGSEFYP